MSIVAGVGAGKVGLPWYLFLAEHGHTVRIYDANPKVVAAINRRESHLIEPGVQAALQCADVSAYESLEQALEGTEACFVYVPTPELPDGVGLDCDIVQRVWEEIGFWAEEGECSPPYSVIVCSTLMPDTLATMWKWRPSDRVDLFYAPPFVALGQVLKDHRTAPVQILGHQEDSPRLAWVLGFYSRLWGRRVKLMSWKEAELGKLFLNIKLTHRARFSADVGRVCELEGVDPRPILDVIGADPRIGPAFHNVGPPPCGPCLPRDVRAMKAWLESLGYEFPWLTIAEDWRKEELLAIGDLVEEAGGGALIVGTSYKREYFGDQSIPTFAWDVFEYLDNSRCKVAWIPAPESPTEVLQFSLDPFPALLLLERNPVAAAWVKNTMKRGGFTLYDPWRQCS